MHGYCLHEQSHVCSGLDIASSEDWEGLLKDPGELPERWIVLRPSRHYTSMYCVFVQEPGRTSFCP